jgi:hypothetical protein
MATQAQCEPSTAEASAGAPAGLSDSTKLSVLRKKVVRRASPDRSQILRRCFQCAFLLLNVWLGVAFYAWVRRIETGMHDRTAVRPAGVEGWLPIAGLMNLKYWLNTGRFPATHPAGMFLFVSFLAMAFFLRKAFCSWLCPIGTASEYPWRAGRKIFRSRFDSAAEFLVPLSVSLRSPAPPRFPCESAAHPAQRLSLYRLRKVLA